MTVLQSKRQNLLSYYPDNMRKSAKSFHRIRFPMENCRTNKRLVSSFPHIECLRLQNIILFAKFNIQLFESFRSGVSTVQRERNDWQRSPLSHRWSVMEQSTWHTVCELYLHHRHTNTKYVTETREPNEW